MNASGELYRQHQLGRNLDANHFSANPPWWRQARSLKMEIALGFGLIIALMVALGVAFHLSEQRSARAIDKLLTRDSRIADLSLRSELAMFKTREAENDFLRSVDQFDAVQARQRYVLQMQAGLLNMREYLTSIRILSSDPSLMNKVGQIEQQAQQYEDGFLAFVELSGKPGQFDKANQSQHHYVTAAFTIEFLLEDLHTTATKRAIQMRNDVGLAADSTRWVIFFTVAVATLLGSIVAIIVWRRINGSVTQLITFSERFAAGDFKARAPQSGGHEFSILSLAMNQMAESIENFHGDLKHQATHDALTGLPNRSLLNDRLEQAISYAGRYHRLVTVVYIDLDGFKLINDTQGHQAGDDLLKVMAERMVTCVRSVDSVVRLGGDEFVVVLFDQPEKGGTIIPTLERLRETIAQAVKIGNQALQVTASLGLATFPADGTDASTLLMNADAAMYRAKALGRNNYQFYAADQFSK